MAEIELTETGDFETVMESLDVTVRTKYAGQAVRKVGNVVAKDARKRVPESRKTGSAEKQSSGVKRKRAGKKSLKKNIKVAVRQYGPLTMALVGGSWPDGAHFHLVEQGHKLVAWGKPTGARIPGKKFFAAAIDTTEAEQNRVAIQTLRDGIIKEGG